MKFCFLFMTFDIPECESEVIIDRWWLCSWWCPFSATPYSVAAKSFSLARELEDATLHEVDDFRFSDIERCTEEDMWCWVLCSAWFPSPISNILAKRRKQLVSGQIWSFRFWRSSRGIARQESRLGTWQIDHSIAWQVAVPLEALVDVPWLWLINLT